MQPFDCKTPKNETELTLQIRKVLRACRTALVDLRNVWANGAERLPLPSGIFVGESDRQKSYAALCRFLTTAQAPDLCLRGAIADLAAIDRTFFACVMREVTDGIDPLAKLWERYQTVRDAWLEFYAGAVTVYSEKICEAADMEHEGNLCDPYAVSRLCGEFIACADAFIHRSDDHFTI